MKWHRKLISLLLVTLVGGIYGYRLFDNWLYEGFWGKRQIVQRQSDFVMHWCTVPAKGRYAEIFKETVSDLKRKGYQFRTPQLLQSNEILLLSHRNSYQSLNAQLHLDENILVFDTHWARNLSDRELRCTFGHELGHAHDRDTNPLFISKEHRAQEEQFADHVGSEACGVEFYTRFLEKYVPSRRIEFVTAQVCQE